MFSIRVVDDLINSEIHKVNIANIQDLSNTVFKNNGVDGCYCAIKSSS